MTDPTQPHDKLFKGLLDQPGAAGALLRERLPPEILELLTDDPPMQEPGEYVDEALRKSYSDRLYSLRLKTGKKLLLYVLIDHKSYPDYGVLLQLLSYIIKIWRRLSAEKTDSFRKLPPILPMVVYHGAAEWKVSLSLRDTINAPDVIKHLQPDFCYELIDLGPIQNEKLSSYPPLRAGLLALKYSHRDGDLETVLMQIFTDVGDERTLFSMLVVYITKVYTDVDSTLLQKVIRKVKPEWEEDMVSIAAREWMAEGKAIGWIAGKAEGEASGKANMLLRQLRRRFQTLPSHIEERVLKATSDQLDEWSELILDATSLDDIFGSPQSH
ncbi:transposase [Azospirillaceae bacterium]